MYSFDTKLRVRYAETDQMGFVYYGVYAQYFEVGRVELLRSIGVAYREIEEMGFALPVVRLEVNYKKPALYDEELTIITRIKNMPTVKIIFDYETFNESGDLINTAEVALVFVNKNTRRPCQAPEIIMSKLKDRLL